MRALSRAAEVAGGVDSLAERLDVPTEGIQLWMSGYLPTPSYVFLKVVDILVERSLTELLGRGRPAADELDFPDDETWVAEP
jgi:hypothetical protein